MEETMLGIMPVENTNLDTPLEYPVTIKFNEEIDQRLMGIINSVNEENAQIGHRLIDYKGNRLNTIENSSILLELGVISSEEVYKIVSQFSIFVKKIFECGVHEIVSILEQNEPISEGTTANIESIDMAFADRGITQIPQYLNN